MLLSHLKSLKSAALGVVLATAFAACTCTPHKDMYGSMGGMGADGLGNKGDNVSLGSSDGPLKDIRFAFDSYALDSVAKSILKQNSDYISQNNVSKIQVEGHCDERGTSEYNMVLGANRARSARDYLKVLGVAASKMSTISYGEEIPLDPAQTEEAWAKNRRAHFKVE